MRGLWLALWAACTATAWPALAPGDEALAQAMWDGGRVAKGDLWQSRVYVDVAWAQEKVAPWQPGWSLARSRIHQIGAGRRAALADDRGGVRRRAPLIEGEG